MSTSGDKIDWSLSDSDIQKQLAKLSQSKLIKLCKSKQIPALDEDKNNIISHLIVNHQSKRNEKRIRKKWKADSICEIYSKSKKQWCKGQITEVTSDKFGEWLQVKYGKKHKQIQRFNPNIRPLLFNQHELRKTWKVGSICEIYSNSKKQWYHGEITRVFSDKFGQWFQVQYGKMDKEIQRFSPNIRPLRLNKHQFPINYQQGRRILWQFPSNFITLNNSTNVASTKIILVRQQRKYLFTLYL
eukprot:311773_1